MFKRITYDSWADIIPIIAFIITFAVFLYFVVRAVRMKKSHAEKMGKLPLDDSPPKDHRHTDDQ